MTKPKLHLPAIAHTRPSHTHCAFNAKVVKFPKMMSALGYDITYYGIGQDGYDIGATHNVEILSPDEQIALLGHDFSDHSRFHGDDANVSNALYLEFNKRLKEAWTYSVQAGDIVLYPFGYGHAGAHGEHKGISVENGIGYPDCFLPFRVYESNAWMHYHQGKEQRQGHHYEWVVNNYFVSEDWEYVATPDDYVLYFGRLTDLKGLAIVVEVAKRRPDIKFVICGQGDPTPYLTSPNIEYLPPVLGKARNALLGKAKAVIMPSLFTEPFGGVAVEAMMTGTPVLTTTFGAFTETIEHGKTGYRCHTLGDFLTALDRIETLDRTYISQRAHSLWSLEAIAPQYDKVFLQLSDLSTTGWYTEQSHWIA
jgi:glycosyltransferase involved in cell wall biosynthesis